MAKRNYLVEGLSGTGKSSVCEELVRRGHESISTDRVWAYYADPATGLPGGAVHYDNWIWDHKKAVSELESPEPEVLFVCGSSRNRDEFLRYFTRIFNLRVDDATMRRRLRERSSGDWELGPEAVELMLELNRCDDKPAGAIDVDATEPLHQVVDDLLRLVDETGLSFGRRRSEPSGSQLVDPFGNLLGLDEDVEPDTNVGSVAAPAPSTPGMPAVVSLRALRESDVDLLIAESAAETRGGVPRNRPRDKLIEQIAHAPSLKVDGYVEYGIEASGALVGTLQVRAPAHAFPPGVCELGIVLFPSARGRGIGPQAVEAVTAQLLDDGWKRIQASTSVSNQAMQRVLALAGYRMEATMASFAPGADATREDYQLWALTRQQ